MMAVKMMAGMGLILSAQAFAVGIPSSNLVIDCSGEFTVSQVERVSLHHGFTDRAGNFHPAKGYANFEVKISKMDEGCEKMQAKLKLDFKSKQLESFQFYKETDLKKVEGLAKLEVGKKHGFKAQQSFSYIDKAKNLPFFPMIHEESVQLSSPTLSVSGAHFQVDTKQAYGIYLYEADKLALADLVFEYLENPNQEEEYGVYMPSVVKAMLVQHPEFESNFKPFIKQVLDYYQSVEETTPSSDYWAQQLGMLSTLASGIRELTHEYPEYYAFDLPNLLLLHPSLVNTYAVYSDQNKCLNLSAVDLEEAMDLLAQELANGSLNPNVVARWKEPLKVISGGVLSGATACIGKLASKQVQAQVKGLIKQYFK